MGGETKSPVWNLRITKSDSNPKSRIMKCLQQLLEAKLACWEVAASEHCHVALVGTDLVRSTIIRRLKGLLDLSGNESYSLTRPKDGQDINGLYRYICKGTGPQWNGQGPDIIENKNLLDIKQYHADYWSAQEAFKEEVKTLAAKKQKDGIKQKFKIISELSLQNTGREATVTNVDDITTQVLAAYKGDVNDNTLFTCVQAIAWTIDPTNTSLQACERMRRKLFANYRT